MTKIAAIDKLARWLMGGARPLGDARAIVDATCEGVVAAGVPLDRMALFIFTLHPHVLGRRLMWRPGGGTVITEAEHAVSELPSFRQSLAIHVVRTGETIRGRLTDMAPPFRFLSFEELKAEGMTDHLIYPLVFTDGETHAASFTTRDTAGFSDAAIEALKRLQLPLARITEAYVLRLNAAFLLSAYVGRNAGRRVLDGHVRRGDTEQVEAAILFCDLKDFTAWSDGHAPGEVIARLNAFFDLVVKPIEAGGGEVLKFMGDGLLAIFPMGGAGEGAALRAAHSAVLSAREAIAAAAGVELGFRAALHSGVVSYGNIGGGARLDFTAIGPAVNLAARLLGVASANDADLVCSDRAAAHLLPARLLGEFHLKGLATPQRVHALSDPERRLQPS